MGSTCDVPVGQCGGGFHEEIHLGPNGRVDEFEHGEEGASPHGVVEEHVGDGPEDVLLKGLGRNGLHNAIEMYSIFHLKRRVFKGRSTVLAQLERLLHLSRLILRRLDLQLRL